MTCPACEAAAKEAQTEVPVIEQVMELQAPPMQEHGCENGRC